MVNDKREKGAAECQGGQFSKFTEDRKPILTDHH